jgi:hypothetical protein
MPKIPLYNQGRGPTQQTPIGQLSSRPDTGAFVAQSNAVSDFANSTSQIAFNFGMAEREREDKRIVNEEYINAFEKLNVHQLNDKSTNVNQALNNLKPVKENILNSFKGKGYSNRRNQLITNSLGRLFAQKQLNIMQDADERGLKQTANAIDLNVAKAFETLNSTNPNDPLFAFTVDAIKQNLKSSAEDGLPTKYNLLNITSEINKIKNNNIRGFLQSTINSATSQSELDSIENNDQFKTLNAVDQQVIRNLAKVKSGELDDNQTARFVDFLPTSTIGETSFDTVESLISTVKKLESDDEIDNENLQKEWKTLPQEKKKKIISAMKTKIESAKRDLDFKNKKKEEDERNTNDQLFLDNVEKARKGDLNLEQINALSFVGTKGQDLKEQLINSALKRAEGITLTSPNLTKRKEISKKYKLGQITSVTQKFLLSGEQTAMSILERENVHLTSQDVDNYFNYFKAENKLTRADDEKQINKFLDSKKLFVMGSSLLSKTPTIEAEERYYTFEIELRNRLNKGKAEGKTIVDMLNPNHPSYVFPQRDIDSFIPSKSTITREQKSMLNVKTVVPPNAEASDYAPPTNAEMGLSENATASEVANHPMFKKWAASKAGAIYNQLVD